MYVQVVIDLNTAQSCTGYLSIRQWYIINKTLPGLVLVFVAHWY